MSENYSETIIQQIIDENELVDVISEYVTLQRTGSSFKARCPFHNEKTPSFVVTPDKQLYHCFGCGAGGNVITFIMNIEKLSFIDSLKFLAERVGLSLPENNQYVNTDIYKKKEKQYLLHKEVALYYYKNLVNNVEVQKYLHFRGISKKTIIKFGLGYAPSHGNGLFKYLLNKKYSIEEMLTSGLILKSKKRDDEYFDRFRDRIIFPIFSITDKIIGFGGRIINNNKKYAKYLNSPETIIYSKGKELYGLNNAKKNIINNQLIVVEGYMDLISLYEKGIKNVAASLGTALTNEQSKLLKRYTNEIIIAYDGDEAGKKATLRGLEVLNKLGINVKILVLPKNLDPDEYINKYGVEAFKERIKKAYSFIEYKIDLLKNNFNLEEISEKINFTKEIAKILANINNEIEVDAYVKIIASNTKISENSIKIEIDKYKIKKNGKNTNGNNRNNTEEKKKNIKKNAYIKVQELILNKIINNKNYYEIVKSQLDIKHFSEGIYSKLAKYIYEVMEQELTVNTSEFTSKLFNEEDIKIVSLIFTMNTEHIKEKDINSYINRIKFYCLKMEIEELQNILKNTQNDEAKLNDIYYRIINKKKQLEIVQNNGKEG